jgi:hypothetical protein
LSIEFSEKLANELKITENGMDMGKFKGLERKDFSKS